MELELIVRLLADASLIFSRMNVVSDASTGSPIVAPTACEAAEVSAALEGCGVTPDRRPQTLAVDEWVCLHAALAGRLAAPGAP